MEKRTLVWFRNDLRLHDNEVLIRGIQTSEQVLCCYVLDVDLLLSVTSFGFTKTGYFKLNFLLESIQNLKNNIEKIGGKFVFKLGKAHQILPQIVKKYSIEKVIAHKEVTHDEVIQEEAVEKALYLEQVDLSLIWGHTLFHIQDLNMPIKGLPDVFTLYRKKTEHLVRVRDEFPTPTSISSNFDIKHEPIPSIEDLGFDETRVDERSVLVFKGGEDEGLARINSYFWDKNLLKEYKVTRNGLIGGDYSSKLSAWLAVGALSPRRIYFEVKKYEQDVKKNDSTYWLIFELLWRDYFRFCAKKYGSKIFRYEGIAEDAPKLKLSDNKELFDKWKSGMTGVPFVDANMRELSATGFMSNRGRQNVASFLVKDLGVNWQWGAAWFESQLIDYDVCSNWLNWMYVAGVGNDPKSNRHFNVLHQANYYDHLGDYVKLWCPELKAIPRDFIHSPELMSLQMQIQFNVEIGKHYPAPLKDNRYWASLKS